LLTLAACLASPTSLPLGSVAAQRDERIDANWRGVAGIERSQDSHQQQAERQRNERHGVARAHAEEQARQEARQGQRAGQPEREADDADASPLPSARWSTQFDRLAPSAIRMPISWTRCAVE
jgi:hypothetical protein